MDPFEHQNLWKYDSEFENTRILNKFSVTTLFQPLLEYEEIQADQASNNINFMSAFQGGNHCKNSLRLLSTEVNTQSVSDAPKEGKEKEKWEINQYFCTYQQNELSSERRYSMMLLGNQGKQEKRVLALDRPSRAIVIGNQFVAAVESKCVTLYRIHEQWLMLKDFDAVGMGNKFTLTQLTHIHYKSKDFLLVFGNQRQDDKPFFKCIVYQISRQKLNFIKKARLFARQTHKPIILFQSYPVKEYSDQQFCLVLGGFSDYQQQKYNFSGLQIHLHLLLDEWIEYPCHVTVEVPFNQNHTITSGKAIKVSSDVVRDECWLLFCTDYQTISKMYMHFGHQKDQAFILQSIELTTRSLGIRDEKSGAIQPIFYGHNSIYLLHVPEWHPQTKNEIPYRLYWCDKSLEQIRSRPLKDMLTLFTAK